MPNKYGMFSKVSCPKISDDTEGNLFEEISKRDLWSLRDSNPRPSACKADALNQLS